MMPQKEKIKANINRKKKIKYGITQVSKYIKIAQMYNVKDDNAYHNRTN